MRHEDRLFNEYLTLINSVAGKPRKITANELDAWVGNSGYSDKRNKWLSKCVEDLTEGDDNACDIRQEIIAYNK